MFARFDVEAAASVCPFIHELSQTHVSGQGLCRALGNTDVSQPGCRQEGHEVVRTCLISRSGPQGLGWCLAPSEHGGVVNADRWEGPLKSLVMLILYLGEVALVARRSRILL